MVIDKGQGIPEPQLARIMEPFFTTHKGSSGLGLPIANAIVTMVGGSLEIHNNSPAPGVCATIRLPRASSTP
jgi:signal transduction histidine kinase